MTGPTENQARVLCFIEERQRSGHTPTIREISTRMGWASHYSATAVLGALERKGFISREKRISRGIRILRNIAQAARERYGIA